MNPMTVAATGRSTTSQIDDVQAILRANRIPPLQRESVSEAQLLALDAARRCLDEVSESERPNPATTAVIVGMTGTTRLQRRNATRVAVTSAPVWSRYAGAADRVVDAATDIFGGGPHDKIGEMSSSLPSRVAIAHGFHGASMALDAVDLTAIAGLWNAQHLLHREDTSAVLLIVVDEDETEAAREAYAAKRGLPVPTTERVPGRAAAVLLRPLDPEMHERPGSVVISDVLMRRTTQDASRADADTADWLRQRLGSPRAGFIGKLQGDPAAVRAMRTWANHLADGAIQTPEMSSASATDALEIILSARKCAPGRTGILVGLTSVIGTHGFVTVGAPDPKRGQALTGTGGPNRVEVRGRGAWFAGRSGVREFEAISRSGRPKFRDLRAEIPIHLSSPGAIQVGRTYCSHAARAGFSEKRQSDATLEHETGFGPTHRAALSTCTEALRDAGADAATGTGLFLLATPIGPPEARLDSPLDEAIEHAVRKVVTAVGVHAHATGEAIDQLKEWISQKAPEDESSERPTLDRQSSGAIAAAVADQLGLDAVPMAVEAACASTLAAVHLAVEALRHGSVDYVIVCGVEMPTCLRDLVLCSALGMLSHTSITPFSAAADGFLPGDGAGALLLRATSHRVPRRTEILGTGGSCDAQSMLAPSEAGQAMAMSRALRAAGINPDSVDYLETHGTGTLRGDAIELASIRVVYGERPVALGSVKSLVGHCFAAAGMAGVLRGVSAVQSMVAPPTAGLDTLDRQQLEQTGCHFPAPGAPYPIGVGGVARAGVSAFGTGGINYHVLLEESDHA